MTYFTIWFHADGQSKVTDWPAVDRETAISEFWDWAFEEYDCVMIDIVELRRNK